ncbi:MAG: ankyrin repeat domain-containing protein, partial [Planctomycetes bacterium]|nr:ankyrin repeat domain-containing protein [Planctomycetota bacterium]
MLQSDWKDEYLWDLDSARTYCESGNPINSRNADGMTPLMLAAGSGADLEILQ